MDGDFLRTSCGSPNYAAPEVIRGTMYAGTEIDVWSCGVILYVMLCGRLPFEDDNYPKLFHKIENAYYHVPSHLSADTRHLITNMLVVDPTKRLTVREILKHPWVDDTLAPNLRPSLPRMDSLSALVAPNDDAKNVIKGLGKIDDTIIADLAMKLGVSDDEVRKTLRKDAENAVKVAYKIMRDQKPNKST
jgi:carbon catabolite-derepressing protein kinase